MSRIPISISPLFWLLSGLIGYLYTQSITGALIWCAVILSSLLVHEYGHALTARAFGQQAAINIQPFGGLTYRSGRKLSMLREFLVVLNGPLAGFALAGVSYLVIVASNPITQPLLHYVATVFFRINLFWTVVNLLPVGPLDGGQLLRISLQSFFGLRGVRIAYLLSVVIGICLGVLFMVAGLFIIGALFFLLTFESFRSWQEVRRLSVEDSDEKLQQMYQRALAISQSGQWNSATEMLDQVRRRAGSGLLAKSSAEAQAALLAREQRYEEAYVLLRDYRDKLGEEGMRLFQQLAFDAKLWKEALQIGTEIYRENPDLTVAVLNARASGRLGDGNQAAGWLESARQAGVDTLKDLVRKSDFDLVREHPRIRALSGQ